MKASLLLQILRDFFGVCMIYPDVLSSRESTCQCRRHRRCRFKPSIGKIPWRRKWQPTPVFLPGKFHGQRSLVDYSPWGHEESNMTEHAHTMMYRVQIYEIFWTVERHQVYAISNVPTQHIDYFELPSVRVFSNELALIRWPKYWSFRILKSDSW